MIEKFSFSIMLLNQMKPYKNQIHQDIKIFNVSANRDPKDHTLMFCNHWTQEEEKNLSCIKKCLILVPNHVEIVDKSLMKNNQFLYVDHPRKHYAIILEEILKHNKRNRTYKVTKDHVVIGENVSIGKSTIIEPFCFIDHNVSIGENCIIQSGVRIGQYVDIGHDTIIRHNSVIGEPGFGVERLEDQTPIRLPQIGGVKVGSFVQIGQLNSIQGGTMEPTIIEDHVLMAEIVCISHNCKIRKNTVICGCVEISGSTVIEEATYIAPNAAFMEGINIGKNCFIGLGAVITKSFKAGEVIAGNPADSIKNLKKLRKIQRRLIEKDENF